jgi:hypothetical protein
MLQPGLFLPPVVLLHLCNSLNFCTRQKPGAETLKPSLPFAPFPI